MQGTPLRPCSEILIMLRYYGFAVIAVAELRNGKHHGVVIRPVNLEDARKCFVVVPNLVCERFKARANKYQGRRGGAACSFQLE